MDRETKRERLRNRKTKKERHDEDPPESERSDFLFLHRSERQKAQILGIPNLIDANEAGGNFSHKCTLILTGGGDSVRDFARAGIRCVDHDYYGVFPLGDELLVNVREAASQKQIMENAEIQHIIQILGLGHGKVYDSVESLRYGHLMIMTNQDSDGSLIKGLFINFIHFFWPSLLKIPKFLMEFISPIVMKRKKKKVYTIKEEARQCFQNLKTHLRYFTWVDETDGDAIDMAFDVNILERKAWILKFEDETCPDDEVKFIRYREFVTKDLMLYSLANMQQSIPSMFDGLKQVQRTILCCALQHDLVTEIWISQFLEYVMGHSAFQYDVESLTEAIIGMSHDFVGTNNVSLLNPEGLFWPGVQGGKSHAPAHCFATNLTPIARLLFPKDDDILLNYPNEYAGYAPVIPLILVNGCQDFGIGWSTFVPNYNPKDLCANVRLLLNGKPMVPMDPWYKGFQGTIERTGASYTTRGKIEYNMNEKTLWITVLPVHTSTECYKEFLDTLCTCTGEIEEPFIKEYREHHVDTTVQFEIIMSKQNLELAMEEGLVNKFKLTSKISTNYMHLCDPKGVIKKYDSPEEILLEFFPLRLHLYQTRMKMLLAHLRLELFKIEYKEKFIFNVMINKKVVVWKREDIFCDLKQKGLLILFQKTKKFDKENSSQATGDLEVNEELVSSFYEDLLSSMNIITLTSPEKVELQKKELTFQMEELESSSPEKLWLKDIDTLEQKLHELNNKDAIAEAEDDRENEAAMPVEEGPPVGSLMYLFNQSEKLHGSSLPKGVGGDEVVAAPQPERKDVE